jgi:hypothetical protein
MAGDNRVAGMFWNLGAQKVDGIEMPWPFQFICPG